jgi:hypothetical protein
MTPRSGLAAAAIAIMLVASGCAGGADAGKPSTKPGAVTSATAPAAAPAGTWPAEVADFAKKAKGPVWYPTALPEGLTIDALDVLELEPGTGFVCDIYYLGGTTEIGFIQGSPTTREYDFVSLEKVAWGTETADVIYEDPEDTSSPKMIVYNTKDNLAELLGGEDVEQLKTIAASMVLVK